MQLYCVICDDEKEFRAHLKAQLSVFAREYGIEICVREYENGDALLRSGLKEKILFLDIDMEGKNGLEAGQEIWQKNRDIRIIYITNLGDIMSKKTAQNRIHAFAYLEKPVRREDLFAQLCDICAEIQEKERKELKIHLQVIGKGRMTFSVKNICYFEVVNGRIKTVIDVIEKKGNGREYFVQDTLTNIEEKLREYGFALSHKAFLVNMRYVQRIREYTVYMLNGDKLPLSQKRSPEFRRLWYDVIDDK